MRILSKHGDDLAVIALTLSSSGSSTICLFFIPCARRRLQHRNYTLLALSHISARGVIAWPISVKAILPFRFLFRAANVTREFLCSKLAQKQKRIRHPGTKPAVRREAVLASKGSMTPVFLWNAFPLHDRREQHWR